MRAIDKREPKDLKKNVKANYKALASFNKSSWQEIIDTDNWQDNDILVNKLIFEMRIAGFSNQQILAFSGLEISISSITNRYNKVLQEYAYISDPDTLKRETDKFLVTMDTLQTALWEKAMAGNVNAAKEIISIWKLKANILGIDNPAPINITNENRIEIVYPDNWRDTNSFDNTPLLNEANIIEGETQ